MRHLACLLVLGFTMPASARARKAGRVISVAETLPIHEFKASPPSYSVGCIKLTLDGGSASKAEKAIRDWAVEYGNPICPTGDLPAGTIVLVELSATAASGGVSGKLNRATSSGSVRFASSLAKLEWVLTTTANQLAIQGERE